MNRPDYTKPVQNMKNNRKQFLDSDTLKCIAVITMLIDHIAAALILPALSVVRVENYDSLYSIYRIMRNIGRTAFPIFVFLLIEGFFHTGSRKKYFGRLVSFALLSEIPYNMAFHGTLLYRNDQNVFWTLSIGFLVIWGLEKIYGIYKKSSEIIEKNQTRRKYQYPISIMSAVLILVLIGVSASAVLKVDYSIYGFLLILLFYLGEHSRVSRLITCIGGYLLFLWEPYCLGGFLLILFYNGKRKPRGKGFQYFFYLFYPLHLLILGLIRVAFLPG